MKTELYTVTIEGQEHIVIAYDIADAIRNAAHLHTRDYGGDFLTHCSTAKGTNMAWYSEHY